jgi:hypothetical protein
VGFPGEEKMVRQGAKLERSEILGTINEGGEASEEEAQWHLSLRLKAGTLA